MKTNMKKTQVKKGETWFTVEKIVGDWVYLRNINGSRPRYGAAMSLESFEKAEKK